jgi:glycosyltransferase involved in cell wall biosynthesis
MKILFVSLLLPHPFADHAGAFFGYQVIRRLSQRHDISLISFIRSEKERVFVRDLEPYCRRVETVVLPQAPSHRIWARANLITLRPISVSIGYCREMRDRIRSMVHEERFHIVQMEYTPMGQYVSEIFDSSCIIYAPDLVFITAKRCAEHLPFSRKKLEWSIDGLLARHYEAHLYAKFDHVLAVSQKIKENLLACRPSLKVSVIPVGVDIPEVRKMHAPGKGKHLIFMGAMWRPENIDAVLYFHQHILGLIRKVIPEVTFTIAGGNPPEEIRQLARAPGIRVTGYVEDLLPSYLENDVSIAPMRIAGGIMCKILDAMAAGLPVITTSLGNEGISARKEEEILVADTPEEFAQRTIELLQDEHLRKKISHNGLDFVRRNFSWEGVIGRLENIYQECLFSPLKEKV